MSAAEKKPCPKCGELNYLSDRNCLSCGALLIAVPRPPPPPPPTRTALPPPVAPTADSGFGALIPARNPSALAAYYLGLFSLIPVLGLPMGIIAFVLGLKGLKFAKATPAVHGTAHAWVGIICGGFWALAYLVLLVLLIPAMAPTRHH
jgi:hypothetical protein